MENNPEKATLAGGCFWCTEAIFKRLKGVRSVLPGYSGGDTENPTYETIHYNATGHAESIQIEFDPKEIPYAKILDVFWHTHNPTTPNQGYDVGPEYRSMIFYHTDHQKSIALKSKEDLEKERYYKGPILTEIVPFKSFYPAETEYLSYYEKNRTSPYCMLVIDPKLQKLFEKYNRDIKEEYKLI